MMAGSATLYHWLSFLSNVRFRDLLEICDHSKDRCILQKDGLLGDFSGLCKKCNAKYVKETEIHQPVSLISCGNLQRNHIDLKFPPTKDFFSASHLEYGTILSLIYCWIQGYSEERIKHELDIGSDHTTVDWFQFCRDTCVEILLIDNKKIGGKGHNVEIDESKFGKCKFNRGKQADGKWVIGGVRGGLFCTP